MERRKFAQCLIEEVARLYVEMSCAVNTVLVLFVNRPAPQIARQAQRYNGRTVKEHRSRLTAQDGAHCPVCVGKEGTGSTQRTNTDSHWGSPRPTSAPVAGRGRGFTSSLAPSASRRCHSRALIGLFGPAPESQIHQPPQSSSPASFLLALGQ